MSLVLDGTWQHTLSELHSRDGAVELSPQNPAPHHAIAQSFRSRVLDFNAKGILLERPLRHEAVSALRTGVHVRVLAVRGDQRWELHAVIKDVLRHRLNEKTNVIALRLSPPYSVRSAQRRSYYRVSTAGAGLEPALLVPLDVQEIVTAPDRPPIIPKSFSAALLNIGGGGVGVEGTQAVAAQLPYVRRYRVVLLLPDPEKPLQIPASVVHLQPHEDGTHYIGLSFEFDDEAEQRRCVDLICRFATEQQRLQLQRRRQ